jgi:osmotically-inducible protein OsmY
MVPSDRVTVTITDGWLTLNGMVDWQYHKDAAAHAVRDLRGVKGVANNIVLQPLVTGVDMGDKIEAALKRAAAIDARRIHVTANDGTVILSGSVHSWAERRGGRACSLGRARCHARRRSTDRESVTTSISPTQLE